MRGVVLVVCAAGCTSAGTLDLELALPASAALRPSKMTSITVRATPADGEPFETTVPYDGTFAIGDLPIGRGISLHVELRDSSGRLAGVGETDHAIDIAADATTRVVLPVRKPFVYAADGTTVVAYDLTQDPREPGAQAVAPALTGSTIAAVGARSLAVAKGSSVSLVATDNLQVTGTFALPAPVRDVLALPGGERIAVAHDQGISTIELATGDLVTAPTSAPVDRVAAAVGPGGAVTIYGLVGRVVPPLLPFAPCTGSSQLATITDDALTTAIVTPLGEAASALAVDATGAIVAFPCSGRIARPGAGALVEIARLERPSALTVHAGRLWAAGTLPSATTCSTGGCSATSTVTCPAPMGNGSKLELASAGSQVVVTSIPLDGGEPVRLVLAEQRETMVDLDDPARQHTQSLHPVGTVPLDIVALPGDQRVAIVTRARQFISELSSGASVVLPCLDVQTSDWFVVDLPSASVTTRVRTRCMPTVGQADLFPNWECGSLPAGEATSVPAYVPISVGAILGAR